MNPLRRARTFQLPPCRGQGISGSIVPHQDEGHDEPMALREIFENAGCTGWLYAEPVNGAGEVVHGADEIVVPASVMKIQVALEVETQIADGRLDGAERIRLDPAERTPGPTGMSLFHDTAEASIRDLVTIMLTISDNAATDALIDRVGLDVINASAARLGLRQTMILSDLRSMIDSLGRDAGFHDYADLTRWSAQPHDPQTVREAEYRLHQAGALRPQTGSRTTARQMAVLLRLIWTDHAGPAKACARIREVMHRQLTRNRIAAAFAPSVRVAAKSGGLMGVIRNEIGVVTYPDDKSYVVAVFTRSEDPAADERLINNCIGKAAAYAIGELR